MCFVRAQRGRTALQLAAQEGKVDVVRLLTKTMAHAITQSETEVYTMSYVVIIDLPLDWWLMYHMLWIPSHVSLKADAV